MAERARATRKAATKTPGAAKSGASAPRAAKQADGHAVATTRATTTGKKKTTTARSTAARAGKPADTPDTATQAKRSRANGAGAKAAGAPAKAAARKTTAGTVRAGKAAKPAAASHTSSKAPATAAGTAAKGATMAKAADTKTSATRGGTRATSTKSASKSTPTSAVGTASRPARTVAETEKIRAALAARRDELREEYDQHLAEIAELQRDRLTDSAGDDQADTGSKTFEREQEISLANSILERITQVERALERLDEGNYGWCERCGNAIPVERLAAFPSATLCITCKQLEERR